MVTYWPESAAFGVQKTLLGAGFCISEDCTSIRIIDLQEYASRQSGRSAKRPIRRFLGGKRGWVLTVAPFKVLLNKAILENSRSGDMAPSDRARDIAFLCPRIQLGSAT